jgi:hypothetical protein
MNRGQAGFENQICQRKRNTRLVRHTTLDANGVARRTFAGRQQFLNVCGKYDAGFGTLCLGDGKGGFSAVPQNQTGLHLRGDMRSVVSLVTGNKNCFLFGCNNGELKLVAFNR